MLKLRGEGKVDNDGKGNDNDVNNNDGEERVNDGGQWIGNDDG